MSADSERIEPPILPPYTGAERFLGLPASVAEFWAYASRDLRSNTVRGILVEWLVAEAVGANEAQPDWNTFDVLTPNGIRVEVKSSAYLQAWSQARHSRIVFSGLKSRAWDAETSYAEERSFNADVYVFCVQTSRTHEEYDPLDVSQWDFYVLPASSVSAIGQRSVSLTRVKQETSVVAYPGLAEAIEKASVGCARSTSTT